MRSLVMMAALTVVGLARPVGAQETRQVTAGPEYRASATVRRWFGDGYRDLWTTPFAAPVLDLRKEAGGLEPLRKVGGLQTAGLAFRGADGRLYTFRSLNKDPERLLPVEWRYSWPAKLVQDAASATHPGAAVILAVLAEAAGVAHTEPRLVVLQDDQRLGDFRAAFAHRVGTFEVDPTAAGPGRPGFQGATAIVPTIELWTRWLAGPEGRVDSRAFLRARLLDLFVDNYDRKRGQWRWMQIPDKHGWQPLPEDPDMAFARHNGLVLGSMRRSQPRLMEFSERYATSLEGPTGYAAEVDRWLLADLSAAEFEAVARELEAAWSDEVIERAVAQLPREWRALDRGFLGRALRARRAALVPYAQRFYRHLADRVDVHLTNQDERVAIETAADGSTTVTVGVIAAGASYYTRRFAPAETREVRLHLHDGNDLITRSGGVGPITVRVIAGRGTTSVESGGTRTEVWGHRTQVSGPNVARRRPWVNPAPVSDGPWIEPRNFGAHTTFLPTAWFAPDVGIVVGASVSRTTYGFRSVPAAKEQTLRGGWAFGETSGTAEYDGTFRRAGSGLGFDVAVLASGIEQINFFGAGNETADQSRSRYRSQQTVLSLAPALRVRSSPRLQLTVGPRIRFSRSGDRAGTVLFEQSPYGTGRFSLMALQATVEADTRRTPAGLVELASSAARGDANDQPPGRGIHLAASTFVAPALWDVRETYGSIDGSVAGYAGTRDLQLAGRIGGARVFGAHPWFDAAFIGGGSDRGLRSHRFGGDASLYANLELRTFVGGARFASVFPVRFGVVAFMDDGRVWLAGERSRRWHPSVGGGVLLAPVGTGLVLRAVLAHSSEGTLAYAGTGFRF